MNKEKKIGRFKRRKKTNYKRALVLIILLLIAIYLYTNADMLFQGFLGE